MFKKYRASGSFHLHGLSTIVFHFPAQDGLWPPVCGLAQFVMRWALMQLILSYNEVAVLRYTYCSILGFMASVREDLVLGFLVALNLVLGGVPRGGK